MSDRAVSRRRLRLGTAPGSGANARDSAAWAEAWGLLERRTASKSGPIKSRAVEGRS
jgi:hypothetical protein